MPPRKPMHSRVEPDPRRSAPRSGTAHARPTDVRPSPYEPSESQASQSVDERRDDDESAGHTADSGDYQTGSDYPAAAAPEDDAYGEASEEALSEEALSEEGHEDIYGEDDYPPEDASYRGPHDDEEPEEELKSRTYTRARGKRSSETRVAPLDDLEEEEEGGEERTRAGPPFKLEITGGPDEGKSKRFRGVRMVVGRAPGCELRLSDQSVSRRHLEMIQGEKGVLLRDLGSGNGTKVNGAKVDERLLEDGDEIAIGKTRFCFVDELAQYRRAKEEKERVELEALAAAAAAAEAAAKQAEAARAPPEEGTGASAASSHFHLKGADVRALLKTSAVRRSFGALSRRQQVGVLAGAASVVVMIAVALFIATRGEAETGEAPPALAQRLERARAALDADRFQDALVLLEQARRLHPGPEVEALKAATEGEAVAKAALEAARAMLDQSRFDDARGELAKVTGASARRMEAKRDLLAELHRKQDDYLFEQARHALELKDLETARTIIGGLSPDRNRLMTARLVELQAALEAARREAEEKAQRSRELGKRREARARAAYVDAAFQTVARKFNAGEYSRATLECDRVADQHPGDRAIRARANELKKLIPSFARNFEDGQRKLKVGALESSVRPMKKARALYREIGFGGALGTVIDEQLASAFVEAGRKSYGRNDLADAARHFREALKLNPSEDRAREGIDRLGAKADTLFSEAELARDRDPREAMAKYRLVLDITPPSSSTYRKAKAQLAALQP